MSRKFEVGQRVVVNKDRAPRRLVEMDTRRCVVRKYNEASYYGGGATYTVDMTLSDGTQKSVTEPPGYFDAAPKNLKMTDSDLNDERKVLLAKVDSLKSSLAEVHAEIAMNEAKAAFMAETGQTEFDPTEFKVYSVLTKLDEPGITQRERAKQIAALIDSQ